MSRKDEKMAQITEAAIREFLRRGVDAASMQNIADGAAVSKRTLYKYFPSKEELYQFLANELLDQVHNMYRLAYTEDTPIRNQLESIVKKKIELTLSETFLNISKIVLGELLKNRPITQDQIDKLYSSESQFMNWIDKGKRAGKIKPTPDSLIMAEMFHAIMKNQIYWPVLFGIKKITDIDKVATEKLVVNFFANSFFVESLA